MASMTSADDQIKSMWDFIYNRIESQLYYTTDPFLSSLENSLGQSQCYGLQVATDLLGYSGLLKLNNLFLGNFSASNYTMPADNATSGNATDSNATSGNATSSNETSGNATSGNASAGNESSNASTSGNESSSSNASAAGNETVNAVLASHLNTNMTDIFITWCMEEADNLQN